MIAQVGGMNVKLIGEANDYVGKGMAGGDITIVPPPAQQLDVRLFRHVTSLDRNCSTALLQHAIRAIALLFLALS